MAEQDARFERLRWVGGERQVVEAPPRSKAEEAEAILMALGGFSCEKCGKTLSEAEGYRCCSRVYCPVCGKGAGVLGAYHDWHCSHLVMRRFQKSLYFEAVSSATDVNPAVRADVKQALKFALPGRRLTGQKIKGTPVWSDTELQEAYGTNARFVRVLFGPTLSSPVETQVLNAVLLEACLHPDLQTNYPTAKRFNAFYFCTDPEAALLRLKTWAGEIAVGTERLRAIPPVSVTTE